MVSYAVSDRVALVTGAGSGIGAAIARLLAANGAAVLVHDVSEAAAAAVTDEIAETGGAARMFVGDVADPAAHEEAVRAASELGPLRIAINNAGVVGADASLAGLPVSEWQRVTRINLDGVYYGMRAQLPAMRGGGAVVNLASVLGSVGFPETSAYVAAKHGVVGLTKSAALEYAAQGIRVNAVAPGFIATPLLAGMDDQTERFLAGRHPLGRLGTPEEVAHLAAFLASDAASFITGSCHFADGGYTAQ